MENKYNELERLNDLRKSGTISETEFEVQKYRILNTTTDNKNKKNKSKMLFIFSFISVVISIIVGIVYYIWQSELWFVVWNSNNKNMLIIDTITNMLIGLLILCILSSIVSLVLAIIFRAKNKGGN